MKDKNARNFSSKIRNKNSCKIKNIRKSEEKKEKMKLSTHGLYTFLKIKYPQTYTQYTFFRLKIEEKQHFEGKKRPKSGKLGSKH